MNLLTEQKETYRLREGTYNCRELEGGGLGAGIVRGFGMDMYKLLFLK